MTTMYVVVQNLYEECHKILLVKILQNITSHNLYFPTYKILGYI